MRSLKIFSILSICIALAAVAALATFSSCNLTSNPTSIGYTVFYQSEPNGGDQFGMNLPPSFNYKTGSFIAAHNNGRLTKKGYTFNGWYGYNNTKHYNEGDTCRGIDFGWLPTGDNYAAILYADWRKALNVVYNGNGNTSGTVPTDANDYLANATVTVLGNTGNLAKTGYAFNVWNTKADGSGTAYLAGATFSMGTASVTLYAQWVATYTVTYNGNGNTSGTAPADNNTYQQGVNVTVLDNTGNLAKTGSTFSGWNTAADGSGTSYMANAIFAMGTANVTLYAQWAPNGGGSQYTVSYDGNGSDGGTVPSDNTSYAANAQATVLGQGSMTMTGFTFTGWNTTFSPPGGPFEPATHYNAGDKITITGNVTLYAEWMPAGGGGGIGGGTYQVTYNGNGNTSGTPPIDSNLYAPGASVNVYGNMIGNLAKIGFTFTGWNTKADGTGTHYAGDGTAFFTINANVTLYAEWQ